VVNLRALAGLRGPVLLYVGSSVPGDAVRVLVGQLVLQGIEPTVIQDCFIQPESAEVLKSAKGPRGRWGALQ